MSVLPVGVLTRLTNEDRQECLSYQLMCRFARRVPTKYLFPTLVGQTFLLVRICGQTGMSVLPAVSSPGKVRHELWLEELFVTVPSVVVPRIIRQSRLERIIQHVLKLSRQFRFTSYDPVK